MAAFNRYAASLPVRPSPADRRKGLIRLGSALIPCALGRGGITHRKREGDGATPAGAHELVMVYYRPDRVHRPVTRLPVAALRPDAGWCDDPADRDYNRPVTLPFAASHEELWRDDRLYDIVVVLDWNLYRPVAGRGSAIFLHLAAPGFAPTAGCIAVTEPAMRRLLATASETTFLDVR
jgi:L,D-peptidoglycan transpeptidase YkuD (ErfK/YbiS/YcfS/YnhG family)